MKKILTACLVAGSITATVSADTVHVEYGSGTERFRVEDVKTTSVCQLKQMVAKKYDLGIRDFDLVRGGGTKLDEDRTLKASFVYNNKKITVKPVRYSNQCD